MVQNSVALVTGTLGLSFPKTAAAMRKAVSYACTGPCSVLVDINWRPVFWESLSSQAVQIVSEYAGGADILKLSEEEAEWLYGVHPDQAMSQPELVRQQAKLTCTVKHWLPVSQTAPFWVCETACTHKQHMNLSCQSVGLMSEVRPWHSSFYGLHAVHMQVLQAVPETVQGILVTAGGHGAAYCFRSANGGPLTKGFVPVLKVKVLDTTGAGDAFLSGFLYSMVKVKLPCAHCFTCLQGSCNATGNHRHLL